MKQYNLNEEVVMYPNLSGWKKIIEITKKHFYFSNEEMDEFVSDHKTEDNGFKIKLWLVMYIYGKMFSFNTDYWEHLNMGLAGKVEDDTVIVIELDEGQKQFVKKMKAAGHVGCTVSIDNNPMYISFNEQHPYPKIKCTCPKSNNPHHHTINADCPVHRLPKHTNPL